jgi:tellurite resistance protein TerC
LFVDVGIVNRKSHEPTRRETLIWSAVWISLALAFNGFVYWFVNSVYGPDAALHKAKEFFTGYLVELSLSIDNLFVFLLIFGYFKVPKIYQHRALFWGIFMALVLRMVMIFAGVELVNNFHWLIYIFGGFLIYTGLKMFREDEEAFHPEQSPIVRLTTRLIPITSEFVGEKFFVRVDGKLTGTMLLLVLIVINVVDLVFAVDSIPAILGITTDRFIVYTSNIFAILGLRTFYFLLADLAARFHYLKIGLAFILSFIGFKMLLPLLAAGVIMVLGEDSSGFARFVQSYLNEKHLPHDQRVFEQILINISLGVVVVAIAISVLLSVLFPTTRTAEDEIIDLEKKFTD